MPQANVAGQPSQPRRAMTEPSPENDDKAVVEIAKPTKEPVPEPALTAADHVPPTQEELAELSISQQNVAKRNLMTPLSKDDKKDPAYKFTDADRKEATKAKWGKEYDWENADLQEALGYLASIRAETEKGGLLLQKRVSELKIERVKCFGCENIINLAEGRWATYRTRNNFETGIPETAYACSAACGLKLNREFAHPVRVPIPVER